MYVEHEAPDRAGGIAAVVHQPGPVGVAPLGGVLGEGLQKVEPVLGREAPLDQDMPQPEGLGIAVVFAR